jgi:hypothetical protein
MLCPPAAGGCAGLGPTAQTERAYCGLHEAAQPTPRAAGAHLPSGCLMEHRMHTRPLQRCALLILLLLLLLMIMMMMLMKAAI